MLSGAPKQEEEEDQIRARQVADIEFSVGLDEARSEDEKRKPRGS